VSLWLHLQVFKEGNYTENMGKSFLNLHIFAKA
jgi:hypothetical protein